MIFDHRKQILRLEDPESGKDMLTLNGEDYVLNYLNASTRSGKGGNSFVFLATQIDSGVSYVAKFCRFHSGRSDGDCPRRRKRFEREVEALKTAKRSVFADSVIGITARGKHDIGNGFYLDFLFMEKADCDLNEFLRKNALSLQQKLVLFHQMLSSLKGLHSLGIYHRDIKPDNILFVGGQWKFGDLGLIAYRSDDDFQDKPREKIGPFGFYSPEAINKVLKIMVEDGVDDSCCIDDKSDVFQLGQLFWYVIAQEVPVGQMEPGDLGAETRELLFGLLVKMLSFRKQRRPALAELEAGLQPVFEAFAV